MNKIKLANIPKKGRGVIADEYYENEDVIHIAPFLVVPKEEDAFICDSFLGDYVFENNDNNTVIGMGLSSFFNHSDRPNAEFIFDNDSIIFIALTSIFVGDEITINYGWDDEELYESFIR